MVSRSSGVVLGRCQAQVGIVGQFGGSAAGAFGEVSRRILTEGPRLDYLADPDLWLAIGLFAAFVIGVKRVRL